MVKENYFFASFWLLEVVPVHLIAKMPHSSLPLLDWVTFIAPSVSVA